MLLQTRGTEPRVPVLPTNPVDRLEEDDPSLCVRELTLYLERKGQSNPLLEHMGLIPSTTHSEATF